MTEHAAVTFLIDAHTRAEALARAARGHNWLTAPGDQPGDSWLIDETMHLAEADTPTAEHVVLHDPAAVLRRVAAERELLAEHKPGIPGFERDDDYCCTCNVPEGSWTYGVPAEWPCCTVLLLAKGWGWEEAS